MYDFVCLRIKTWNHSYIAIVGLYRLASASRQVEKVEVRKRKYGSTIKPPLKVAQ